MDVNYNVDDLDADAGILMEQYHELGTFTQLASLTGDDKLKIIFDVSTRKQRKLRASFELLNQLVNNSSTDETSAAYHTSCESICGVYRVAADISISNKDNTAKQLAKDLLRDKLIINGNFYLGSVMEIDSIIASCQRIICSMLNEFKLNLPKYNFEQYCRQCLQLASRTHSGSKSFTCLQERIEKEEFMVVPLSSLASPLKLNFSVGYLHHPYHIGAVVRCHIDSVTVFRVVSITNSSEFAVNASYNAIVNFDIDEKQASVESELVRLTTLIANPIHS